MANPSAPAEWMSLPEHCGGTTFSVTFAGTGKPLGLTFEKHN